MKRFTALLLVIIIVLSLTACGAKRPNGVYAMCFKMSSGEWVSIGGTEKIEGTKVTSTDYEGKVTHGTITYDGDKVEIKYEDGLQALYTYNAEDDALYDATGLFDGKVALLKTGFQVIGR